MSEYLSEDKQAVCRPDSPARLLDVAKGILVGLRRCHADQAFTELVEVSRKYAVSPLALATALVEEAGGRPGEPGTVGAARAAEAAWGRLLAAEKHMG